MNHCNICHQELSPPIYRSPQPLSLTSLCELRTGYTEVFACEQCCHLQTAPLPDIVEYYDQHYRILLESEDEDQLCQMPDGRMVFRSEHQAEMTLAKAPLPSGAAVLDYGCAKGQTMRRLLQRRSDLRVHLFDVSERYRPFWSKFVAADRCACHALPEAWNATFDLITAQFVAEHVTDLHTMFGHWRRLLKPGGLVLFTVPNVFANVADFVVADHVNHFSRGSLALLMGRCGFEQVAVDEAAHESAFVVRGAKAGSAVTFGGPDVHQQASFARQALQLSRYWCDVIAQVRAFESAHRQSERVAIYGSGFYGAYIASCLADLNKVACFLDANPHRQGQTLFGRPIVAPQSLDPRTRVLYVGLNPRIARAALDNVAGWHRPDACFFLPEGRAA